MSHLYQGWCVGAFVRSISFVQETVIQEGDYIRLRIVGTRVDANDIVSRITTFV